MKPGRLQLLALLVFVALVMALLLRDVVEQLIIRPAAYLFWALSVFYRFIPQPVIWLLLVLVLLYFTLGSFARRIQWFRRKPKTNPIRGPLDDLAMQIERKGDGIYFKWQIARTLGEIALDIQELRQHTHRRKLDFNTAAIEPRVRHYLDAGLNTSFSDFPLPGGLPLPGNLKSLPPTPFDGDIGPVLDYLETQMENDDDRRRA